MVGIMVGLMAGGMLSELYGWRATFLILGFPGVLMGAAIFLFFKEPQRGAFEKGEPGDPPPIGALLQFLFSQKSYVHLIIAYSLLTLPGYGLTTWMPSYIARSYEISQSSLGVSFGLVFGLSTISGMIIGGIISSRLMRRDARLGLLFAMIGTLIMFPLYVLALLATTLVGTYSFYFFAVFFGTLAFAPILTLLVELVFPKMRAMASAISSFGASLIGMGFGPLLTGVLSDFYGVGADSEGLRWAMITVCSFYLLPLFSLWLALKTLLPNLAVVGARPTAA